MAINGARLTYRPELDAIRGIAVLLVLAQHFGLMGVGPDHGRAGQVGVTLFFVLSGYLITGLLMAERAESGTVSLRRFYVRRMRRLFPALAFMVAVVWMAGLPGNPLIPLTYTSNVALQLGAGGLGAYVHTWTLAIEEQFYLIWPVAFLALIRRPRTIVPVLLVIVVGSWLAYPLTGQAQRADALLAGALLAIAKPRIPRWVGAAGWVGVIAAAVIPGRIDGWLIGFAVLGSVAVVGASGMSWRPIAWLGTISYGVYLWSYPISFLVQTSAPNAGMAVGIAVTIVMAAASERWVERRWRVRRLRDDQPVEDGAVPIQVARRRSLGGGDLEIGIT